MIVGLLLFCVVVVCGGMFVFCLMMVVCVGVCGDCDVIFDDFYVCCCEYVVVLMFVFVKCM